MPKRTSALCQDGRHPQFACTCGDVIDDVPPESSTSFSAVGSDLALFLGALGFASWKAFDVMVLKFLEEISFSRTCLSAVTE